eukprot:TRINITY_DN1632_c0_g2_i2.p1 TRINITY_DN1632_c0_g2~~TRINITY_DN1632_c0_g2_i2.p1  ORF type:complete len:591 (-),score=-20.79 TRINITY_DN1632_c0_g2_i2:219-1991(-)
MKRTNFSLYSAVLLFLLLPIADANWWDPFFPLPIDFALVQINGSFYRHGLVQLYGVSSNCYNCVKQLVAVIYNNGPPNVTLLDTRFQFEFEVRDESDRILPGSAVSFHFGEHGVYDLVLSDSPDGSAFQAEFGIELQPTFSEIPLLIWLGSLLAAWLLWTLCKLVWARRQQSRAQQFAQPNKNTINSSPTLPPPPPSTKPKTTGRLRSLDTFRGASLCIMIFVNYGGGRYWYFNHSAWNGLTVADLVFPWFIFIMGAAIPMAFGALERNRTPRHLVLYKIVRRSIILFCLGMFLINNGYDLDHWRVPGVLQRFAVSYLAVSLIVVFVPSQKPTPKPVNVMSVRDSEGEDSPLLLRAPPPRPPPPKWYNGLFGDIGPFWLQWLVVMTILFAWLMLTFVYNVPGCGAGYLGPGGIGDGGKYQNCTGGAAGYIDKMVLGPNHSYQSPTCKALYLTEGYDPEGILGCLTSIFLCFLGVQVSSWLVFLSPALCVGRPDLSRLGASSQSIPVIALGWSDFSPGVSRWASSAEFFACSSRMVARFQSTRICGLCRSFWSWVEQVSDDAQADVRDNNLSFVAVPIALLWSLKMLRQAI